MAVMLVTSVGELVVDLFTDLCPLATKNFLKLCKYVQFSALLGVSFPSIQLGLHLHI
jgi:peptidyl-prolyl cis-trans isomerase-like 4